MATRIGLGVPMPILAPATSTWAAPMALYYLFLQSRIVYHRHSTHTYGHPRVKYVPAQLTRVKAPWASTPPAPKPAQRTRSTSQIAPNRTSTRMFPLPSSWPSSLN